MRVQKYKVFIFFIFALFISNCEVTQTLGSSKEDTFELFYPSCTMNSAIQFLPLQTNHKLQNDIILNYKNYSQERIVFPPGSGVKILIYEQNDLQWKEVKNKMQYSASPEPYIIIEPGDELSSYGTVVISPDTVRDNLTEIRVVITGRIYRNNSETEECVGAFIDMQL